MKYIVWLVSLCSSPLGHDARGAGPVYLDDDQQVPLTSNAQHPVQSALERRARGLEPDGKLVFELTMGTLHVYFPDQDRWLVAAPDWAEDKWQLYADACRDWCRKERIPMSIVSDASLVEEK